MGGSREKPPFRREHKKSIRRWMTIGVALVLSLFSPMPSLAESEKTIYDGMISPSVVNSLPQEGAPFGIRKRLSEHGILFGLIYTNDVLSNLSGGKKRGAIDQGLLEGRLMVDFEKLAGWEGLTLYSNGFQIDHTGRFRRDYVGGLNTIAAIEATATTRLSELWVQQAFLGGSADLRIGQLAADTIFFFAESSAMFLQSDWPTIAAADLPSGGPAYPLSTPGARLRVDPGDQLSILLGVFNGDPAGPGRNDQENRNRNGVNFRLSDPPLIMIEAQVRYNQGKQNEAFAGILKLGAWIHLGEFNDQRFAGDQLSLANPLGGGVPESHRGNFGIYVVIDQQIYHVPGGDSKSGIAVYSRASLSPPDRNLIDAYIDAGVVFDGMIPSRAQDRFGAGFIYSRFSDRVRAFDRDQIEFTGVAGPVRDYEANLELTYAFQVIPGWTVQPDFQYIWHPSGESGRNATVVGLRSSLQF